MAEYFARIEDDIVTAVHVVADEIVADGGEEAGVSLLQSLHGGDWVRFSRKGEFRYNRAQIGSIWDAENEAFYPPQPFPSWSLNESFVWEPPIPYPSEGAWDWDEDAQEWVATVGPA